MQGDGEKIEYVKGYKIFLNRKLGDGAYSEVFAAKLTGTGEEVACKKTKLVSKSDLIGAEREIEILEKLKGSQHVLNLYESSIDKSNMVVYTFMPLMEESLDDFLQSRRSNRISTSDEIKDQGRLPEGETLEYFYQLMKGLKEIHAKKMIHRDLKPDNIFLDGSKIFIGDFNLSIQAELATSMLGTPRYMCPLILTTSGGVGAYVDLWSAGLVLFRMLYGYHLYDHMQLQYQHRDAKDYVIAMANKIQDDGVIFPVKPSVTQGTKLLIKKLLDQKELSKLTAEEVLRDPVFAKYIAREDKEQGDRPGTNFGNSNHAMMDSFIQMKVSQVMRTSKLGIGDELTSNLIKTYQKIMLNQKVKTLYLWQLILYCSDYFDYYDHIRRTQISIYRHKYRAHHRDAIFFMLMMKGLHLIVSEEVLEGLEDRGRFNEFRRQSNIIDKDIDQLHWAQIMAGSDIFRRDFKMEFTDLIEKARQDVKDNMEFLRENYEGLIDPKKAEIMWHVLSEKKKNEHREVYRERLRYVTNRFFIIIAASLSNAKLSDEGIVLARKIIVLVHYFEKYKNAEKFDWTKAYVRANNLETEKEDQIISERANEAKFELSKRQTDTIVRVIFVSILFAAIILMFFMLK